MEKSAEPKRKKAVVEPAEVQSVSFSAVAFFFFGMGCSLVGLLAFVLLPFSSRGVGGTILPGIMIILEFVVPLFITARFQSTIRTIPRSMVAGAAFGAGTISLFGFSMLFNSSWRTLRRLLITGIAVSLIVGLANGIFLFALNRLRPLKPIQDGTMCPECTYSLIGNTSGICPECGCQDLPNRDLALKGRLTGQ